MKNTRKYIGRVFICIGTAVLLVFLLLFSFLWMVCRGKSDAARNVFVATMLETGALKWVPSVYLSGEEIEKIVAGNKREPFELNLDSSLIKIEANAGAGNGAGTGAGGQESVSGQRPGYADETEDIEVISITARTFFAKLMIIKDPSRVSMAAPYYDYGHNISLEEIVEKYGAVGGINGGLYKNFSMTGNGGPVGVVVTDGKIRLNDPAAAPGMIMIYINKNNILFYTSIEGWSKADVESFVEKEGIRDACVFQEEQNKKIDHFVPLIVNNIPRDIQGTGSGMNPRTCIGQRADGAIMMLTTDGRGSGSHLGATAADLIEIMQEHGAVNAFNLDGGSSTCMYYDNEYLMTSSTLVLTNSSWILPDSWIVR